MTRFLIVGILLLCFLGNTEIVANPLDTGKKKGKIKESFYYALPENYFTVTVVINKISIYKGPLQEYADKITGLSSVVKEDAVYYAISCVSLEEHACIDFNHIHYVETTHKNTVPYHFLYKDLLLSAYKPVPIPSWMEKQFVNQSNMLLYAQNRFNVYSSDAVIEKYDTTYVLEMRDSVMMQIPKITKRLVAKPTQQQADEAIKMIESIREARWLLISGDHEVNYTELELMLSELQKKENEYAALFAGITEKEELTYTFTVFPSQKDSIITFPLFYFSEKQGIRDYVSKVGEKINYTLRLKTTEIHKAVEEVDKKFTESKAYKKDKKAGKNSLYYRKPQYFWVSLYEGDDLVKYFGIYPISQFGETVPLPTNTSFFEIDPLTGALKYTIRAK
jgi:hypothetical protein